jgi:acetate kinase
MRGNEGDDMKILVINTGSSSIKYQLFEMADKRAVALGLVEKIGEDGSRLTHEAGAVRRQWAKSRLGHREGMELIVRALTDAETGVIADTAEIGAVGHRVVHGGERFRAPALIDDEVIAAITANIPLAPLHNPANLIGIEAARTLLPAAPQVAVFDTAFHQTLPPRAFHYGLPYEMYERHHIRRYGFHGTSHQYVAKQAAKMLGRPLAELNLITIHLGNGSSITAIEAGHSVDTSMGMTPLEGLLMGTRSGDLDPSILFHLAEFFAMSLQDLQRLLNHESGLKGLAGVNDMREILTRMEGGDPFARLAFDLYVYRVKKYLGAYYAVLGRVDAVVFTAGVGENSAEVRAAICAGLDRLGIAIDPVRNAGADSDSREVQASSSPVKVLVIPTNEELEIAEQTLAVVNQI